MLFQNTAIVVTVTSLPLWIRAERASFRTMLAHACPALGLQLQPSTLGVWSSRRQTFKDTTKQTEVIVVNIWVRASISIKTFSTSFLQSPKPFQVARMRLITLIIFATAILARDVPNNVRAWIDRVKSGKCTGGTVLQDGFYSEFPGSKSTYFFVGNPPYADTLQPGPIARTRRHPSSTCMEKGVSWQTWI